MDVMKTAFVIDLFPKFIRKYVLNETLDPNTYTSTRDYRKIGRYLTKLPYYVEEMSKHLRPVFDERLRMKAESHKTCTEEPVRPFIHLPVIAV